MSIKGININTIHLIIQIEVMVKDEEEEEDEDEDEEDAEVIWLELREIPKSKNIIIHNQMEEEEERIY